jgi:hypothetical protein
VPFEVIVQRILLVPGHKVRLDSHLAGPYDDLLSFRSGVSSRECIFCDNSCSLTITAANNSKVPIARNSILIETLMCRTAAVTAAGKNNNPKRRYSLICDS